MASEVEGGADSPFSPSPLSPPPVFSPPPPQASVFVPPPPPPVLPQGKPGTVASLSANASMNPAMAREAMLEAIRSGAAAERLKKVKERKCINLQLTINLGSGLLTALIST